MPADHNRDLTLVNSIPQSWSVARVAGLAAGVSMKVTSLVSWSPLFAAIVD